MSDKRRVRLNELITKRAENDTKALALLDKDENSADEIKEINRLNAETKSFIGEIEELKGLISIREGAESRTEGQGSPANLPGHSNGSHGSEGRQVKSLGEIFANDPAYQEWIKANPSLGAARTTFQSPRVEVPSFFKTLVTAGGATSAAPFIWEDQKRDLVDEHFKRPLTVRDLITIGTTESDTVEYVRVTGITNNAAGVPEADSILTSDDTGRKPESAIATERVSESVKTIAHWIPATTRSLQDAGQLRTLIDSMLRYGLDEQMEDDMLNGTGSDTFTGIFETSGISTQTFSTDLKTTARKARTKVRVTGRSIPTAILLHPTDVERLDLDINLQGNYYWGGPLTINNNKTLWGVPVVECEAVAVGIGLIGDFKKAVLWDRMQSAISASNSHSDFFVKNLTAVLAELRAAFGVIRPSSFCSFETISGGS